MTFPAGLGVDKDGPAMVLWDENGNRRVRLWASKDGSRLSLFNEDSIFRIGLGATKDRSEMLQLDKNGKLRVQLWAPINGPILSLWDENGIPRAGLGMTKDGPGLTLFDKNGGVRFVAGNIKLESLEGKTTEYPESSLILFGPDGKVIWSAIK